MMYLVTVMNICTRTKLYLVTVIDICTLYLVAVIDTCTLYLVAVIDIHFTAVKLDSISITAVK